MLFPGRPIILNIGQLEARKNQRYLVAVAAELRQRYPGCVTVLVGKGEDEAMLRTLVAEQDLADTVVLLGYHSQVAPLLHAADIYVHTATRENCPYAVIEAMAAGCPTLALAAGTGPEIAAEVANHAAGVVVGKLGTATLSPAELLASFERNGI